jgi:hypothetical protein
MGTMKRLATPMPCTKTTGSDPAGAGSTETQACIGRLWNLIHLLPDCPLCRPTSASVTAAPADADRFVHFTLTPAGEHIYLFTKVPTLNLIH